MRCVKLYRGTRRLWYNWGKHRGIVMLSAAKHLTAEGERPFAAAQGDTCGKHEHGSIVILELSISFEPCPTLERGVILWGEARDAINRVRTIWRKYAAIFPRWTRILFFLIILVGHRLRGRCCSELISICALATPITAERFAPAGSLTRRWPRRGRRWPIF